jgi:enterobactin synthetase component D
MQAEFNIQGVSIFGAQLPLSSDLEQGYAFCLPEGLQDAAQVRKQEFIAGRYCAIQAAKNIGLTIESLPRASTREPIWPLGITGSISHSKQMAISCISKSSDYLSLGIDSEELIKPKIASEVAATIGTQDELAFLASLDFSFGLTVMFSAKEALYKALFPLARTFIDFKDVKLISLDPAKGDFELELISSHPLLAKYLGRYVGTFRMMNQTIVTFVSIPKDQHVYS